MADCLWSLHAAPELFSARPCLENMSMAVKLSRREIQETAAIAVEGIAEHAPEGTAILSHLRSNPAIP
jgi:hypothetical protein